ncbi:MAG TPA: hypothetical protein VFP87_06000 [Chitinophagaceae bacterium]|nr:hypothetical protein [Chitinophagaceae bacterium]
MKDQDLDPEFSWPLALLVTGACFLFFFFILGKLNENSPRLFLWIGIASLILSFLSGLVSLCVKQKTTAPHEEVDQ